MKWFGVYFNEYSVPNSFSNFLTEQGIEWRTPMVIEEGKIPWKYNCSRFIIRTTAETLVFIKLTFDIEIA
jgi:hypothetical protein